MSRNTNKENAFVLSEWTISSFLGLLFGFGLSAFAIRIGQPTTRHHFICFRCCNYVHFQLQFLVYYGPFLKCKPVSRNGNIYGLLSLMQLKMESLYIYIFYWRFSLSVIFPWYLCCNFLDILLLYHLEWFSV